MKFKDRKISTQLIIGFSAMMMLVTMLGIITYNQSDRLYQQTETIYNHPLKVQIALGDLESGILVMRLATRDLMLARNDQQKQDALQAMKLAQAKALQQFNILTNSYLGNKEDIDDAYNAFTKWNLVRDENTKLATEGKIDNVLESVGPGGKVGILRDQMMAKIQKIDDFATQKSDSLFENATQLRQSLRIRLFLLIVAILLMTIIITYYLIRSIRKPIDELTIASTRFQDGDMHSRSRLELKNEFGVLSNAFNSMIDRIQLNTDLADKTTALAGSMLKEDNAHTFFRELLPVLSNITNSQMAAVYLLSDDKKSFYHYESVGMDNNVSKLTFSATSFEGEFGKVIASRKIESIKSIPLNTQFVFQTVSGKFIPREIITIPIIADREISAIFSLASVRNYSDQSNQLISNIHHILTARVEGILTYRKLRKFSKQLEIQNTELEAQKTELAAQSAELTEQNIELEIQKSQLFEVSRLKTNFLSNMSHELRTPLNSVIALSGVLNRRLANKIPDEEYSYLEVIERNGKHLLLLINDILDISRIEAGREEIEISKFSVNNLIQEIVDMIKPQANQNQIDLIYNALEKDILIVGDSDKSRHILQNLIANAVKFTENGKVEISVSKNKNNIEINVADTGIGIADNHLPHIFDEFRQADGSTSRRFGGTGLGLSIAKKYANMLGGNISVKSILDKGSLFTLTLPLTFESKDRMPVEAEETPINFKLPNFQTPLKSDIAKTILLVDDSQPAVIQVKDFMEENGYNVLIANNGAEALEIISETVPDAIILDLMMPEIDGFEVLKTVREAESTAHIPVLILTAKHITKDDLKFLKRNNVHQLIQKGDVNRNELLNAVASMVFPQQIETDAVQQKLQTIEGKPVVLVVEDNLDNMITLKAIIEDKYIILEAADGNEGVIVAKKYKPNLILMDISLPNLDGIEAFKAIRHDLELQHTPIIALTASAMNSDREIILAHGFDDYLSKPIDEAELFKSINKVLYGK